MLKIERILMDYEISPVGVGKVPQFAWEITSDARNIVQGGYQLQIALDTDFKKLVYDSGDVKDSASTRICPQGVGLLSSSKYYVRVKVGTNVGQSGWSETHSFVTALLANKDWCAPFISAETDDRYKECSKGTLVRGVFTVQKPLESAFVHTTALGLYNFFVNGEKVGDDEMAPGWTSYNKHLLYQTYDVLPLLKEGNNIAGAMLGAGWYKGVMGLTKARNNYGDKTAFAMQMVLRYKDGTSETITTNDSWQGADSPIIFSEIYDGEIYDASLEIDGWASANTPSGQWRATQFVQFDTAVLRAQAGARVKLVDKMPAKRIFTTPNGETVVDFGQNFAGRIEVTANGKAGDVIELRCFEVLDADGNVYVANLRNAKTSMKYTFAKAETITWHPRFTFMGFCYAEVISWPGIPEKKQFTAYSMHSQMEETGSITTSNQLLNQLHHNIKWGLKSNFLDVPTDCPQRDERLGWTGDAQIFCRTSCYLVNAYTFYKKWLVDVAADQTEAGGVAHVVPNIELGRTDGNWLLSQGPDSAAAWADVAVIAPWTLYLMYGDTEILTQQYTSMKAWIDFMQAHSTDYIWNYKLQFGDWVALDAEPGSYFGATPNDITCTAYFAYSTSLFVKAARVLGKNDVADEYAKLHEKIVQKFQSAFFDKDGNMAAQTQTAHIVALYFGLTAPENKAKTVAGLKRLLEKENGHLVTGFVGTPYFCHALSENGAVKEAYGLLLKEDFPSWLYQVKMGATTVWEHWDGIKPDGSMWSPDMNSFNHYAYGAVAEWMYRVMGGIETDEQQSGFAKSIIYPRLGGDLRFVESYYKTTYGTISVKWEVEEDIVTLTVEIPANTTAFVRLDGAKTVTQADGADFVACENDFAASVGSGSYEFKYLR